EAVLLFTVWLIVSLAAGLLVMAALHHYGPKMTVAEEKFSGFIVSTISFQGASLFLTHFFIRRHYLTWSQFLGLRSPNLRRSIYLGVATGALVLPFIYFLNHLSERLLTVLQGPPEIQPTVQVLQLTVGVAQRTAFGLAAIVLAPVCEEILFRGILYNLIK